MTAARTTPTEQQDRMDPLGPHDSVKCSEMLSFCGKKLCTSSKGATAGHFFHRGPNDPVVMEESIVPPAKVQRAHSGAAHAMESAAAHKF